MIDMTKVQAALTEDSDAHAAIISLVQTLAAEVKDANAGGDQAAVDALADQISTSAKALADAVTANTPAAPAA